MPFPARTAAPPAPPKARTSAPPPASHCGAAWTAASRSTISSLTEPSTMSTPHFHELFVKQITPQAAGAVAVTLAIPPELRDAYAFQPGQFLTLRASIQGEAVRRSYSICSSTQQLTRAQ